MLERLKFLFAISSVLFGITILIAPIDYSYEKANFRQNTHEAFNPILSSINSLEMANDYIEKNFNRLNQDKPFDSFLYLQVTKNFVKQKFYHGNAAYSWKENWICYLLGKYIWSHFNSKVSPNEVIKHSGAMCSQQAMVFARLMSLKGFRYRYVYLKNSNEGLGHFCSEIWYGNDWHFVDVNQEPNWDNIKGLPNQNIEVLKEKNKLELIYKNSAEFMQQYKSKTVEISYSPIDAKLGSKMMLFQFVTKWLSRLLPIIVGVFLILDILYFSKRKGLSN